MKNRLGLRRSSLILVSLFLFGCTSDAEQRKQDKETAAEAAKAFGAVDDAKCQSYGLQRGSPAYIRCRADFENIHKQGGAE